GVTLSPRGRRCGAPPCTPAGAAAPAAPPPPHVRPGAATALVADVVPAMLLYQVKICGRENMGPGFGARLMDEVLYPLIRA
ncbi:hypothetical protein ACFV84_08810, partial [Kitasatospora sp. NPDC059811]